MTAPQPSGGEAGGQAPTTDVDELPGLDWRARLAAQNAEWRRRRAERAEVRRQFAEARRHGLAARHTAKLRRGGQQ